MPLFEQPARPRTQKRRQRIVDLVGLAKVDNAVILVHGVSLPRGGSGRLVTHLDTSPSSPRHHPISAIALLVDRAPQIVLDAVDLDEHLVQMPAVARPRPTPPQPVGEGLRELPAPPPARL